MTLGGGDIPSIETAYGTTSTYDPASIANMFAVQSIRSRGELSPVSWFGAKSGIDHFDARKNLAEVRAQALMGINLDDPELFQFNEKDTTTMANKSRLVRVFIVDSEENIPLYKRLIYSGEEKFTDSTDQELFFEIDIKSILEAHNAYRITVVNKKVKERVEYLEPVKIRELKMMVAVVAEF